MDGKIHGKTEGGRTYKGSIYQFIVNDFFFNIVQRLFYHILTAHGPF